MAAGWHSSGKLSLEVTLTRQDGTAQQGNTTRAHMMLGTTHDDALLLHEGLVLERFPSPYTWHSCCDISAAKGEPVA